jgi:hypothetical protein
VMPINCTNGILTWYNTRQYISHGIVADVYRGGHMENLTCRFHHNELESAKQDLRVGRRLGSLQLSWIKSIDDFAMSN